jgi:hypothetical protein
VNIIYLFVELLMTELFCGNGTMEVAWYWYRAVGRQRAMNYAGGELRQKLMLSSWSTAAH